jgi:hypothetical protein
MKNERARVLKCHSAPWITGNKYKSKKKDERKENERKTKTGGKEDMEDWMPVKKEEKKE